MSEGDYDMEVKINSIKDLLDKIEGTLDTTRSARLTGTFPSSLRGSQRSSPAKRISSITSTPARRKDFASSSVFRASSATPGGTQKERFISEITHLQNSFGKQMDDLRVKMKSVASENDEVFELDSQQTDPDVKICLKRQRKE